MTTVAVKPEVVTGKATSCTADVAHRIVDVVRSGGSLRTAAAVAGVGWSTLVSWRRRARELENTDPVNWTASETAWCQLAQDIEFARAALEVELCYRWTRAAATDWRAAASLLALRFPDDWSPTRRFRVGAAVTVTDRTHPVVLDGARAGLVAAALDADPEAAALAAALAARVG